MRALGLLFLLASIPAEAGAAPEPTLPARGATPEPDDDDPSPPLIPSASDKLGGHVIGAASAGLVAPWGELDGSSSAETLGAALGLGIDVGYGVSRSVVLGVWGQYTLHRESVDCGGCRATGYALGPFIRYHLVQGLRFDPWLLAGLGYRTLSVETPASGTVPASTADYSGVEWLRLAVGGDYYPLSGLGFGPMLELDAGVYGNHPNAAETSGVHWSLVAGLRVILDVPGR